MEQQDKLRRVGSRSRLCCHVRKCAAAGAAVTHFARGLRVVGPAPIVRLAAVFSPLNFELLPEYFGAPFRGEFCFGERQFAHVYVVFARN